MNDIEKQKLWEENDIQTKWRRNQEMADKILIFLFGAIAGAFLFWMFLMCTGGTPMQRVTKIRVEAINLGYAHWAVDTNKFYSNLTPETRFEWITNK